MNRSEPPPFEAPWQAQLFALTVALNEAGHVDWADWAGRFSALRGPDTAPDGHDYFHHWLDALEALVADGGIAARDEIAALSDAWARAAAATPHGVAVTLANDPEALG